VAPIPKKARAAVEELAAAIGKALEKRREEGELEREKQRIRELEAKLAEAQKEVERLKTALAVKETIKVEVKPAELRLPAEPQIRLPSVVESLDSDARQVWALLKQKPVKYKVELMAAFGWGRRRLNRALRTLQNRRLLKVEGRRLNAAEPII